MKKFISFCLVFCLIFTSFVTVNAINLNLSYLSDTDMHWAEEYITSLFDMGVMMGENGKSNAEKNITRGEFTALITRYLFDLSNYSAKTYFSDVNKNHIFYENISIAKENNIVKGDLSGNFNPDASITREEIVIIISRLLSDKKQSTSTNMNFNDIKKSYTYYDELLLVSNLGIISGDLNGNFLPHNFAKRGECAKMIYMTIENYGSEKDQNEVLHLATDFVENNTSDNLTASAKIDFDYQNDVRSYAKALSFSSTKKIYNTKAEITKMSNGISEVLVTYNTLFTLNYPDGNIKTKDYSAKMKIKLMHKNGKWQIFKTNESLFLSEKINLTWEVFNSAPSYAPSGLNVVSPTWYEIISDNSYKNSQTVYSDGTTTLKITDKSNTEYLNYVEQNGYDLWIAYRNNFDANDTEVFFDSKSARKSAVEFLISGVIKTKADGINLDFENMKDKYKFTNHAKEVALAMRALGLITSADINKYDKYGGNWSLCYDRDALNEVCDYLAVMAYDQNGTWSTKSGPIAALDWVEEVTKSVLDEVDNEKLILAVPFYVRHWKEKNGKVVKTSAISMQRANEIIKENNAKVVYNQKYGQDVATWSDGEFDYTIYLENAKSISNKASLINKYNLAGVASWRRGFETMDIWNTLKNILS